MQPSLLPPPTSGIHSPAWGSSPHCHPHSLPAIPGNGGSSCPDVPRGAPVKGPLTFLHLPEMLQQDGDGLLHDAGVDGDGCQGLQAALPQGAVVTGALLLPL